MDLQTKTGLRWEMTGPGEPLQRRDFGLEESGPGDAVVRVAGCGVCHTDLGFLYDGVATRAPLPLALGHEISGVVEDAGPEHADLVGRAVIVPAVTPCGTCAACAAGHGTICPRQTMPGNDTQGGFASHVVVPARGLCPVDGGAELDGGATVGDSGCTLAELSVVADAVTTPYQAIRRARVGAGDFVVVVGLGGVGGFAVQIARALGATVVGVDVDPKRLEMLSAHGLERGFDPSDASPHEIKRELRAFAKGQGLPGVRWKIFECSGTAAGQALAWGLLCHGAYLSIVGFTLEKTEVRLSNLMALDAKAAGNWGCLPELYPEALELVTSGAVAVAPFVETYPLDQVQSVLEDVHAHRLSHRPVLVP